MKKALLVCLVFAGCSGLLGTKDNAIPFAGEYSNYGLRIRLSENGAYQFNTILDNGDTVFNESGTWRVADDTIWVTIAKIGKPRCNQHAIGLESPIPIRYSELADTILDICIDPIQIAVIQGVGKGF